MDRDAWDQKAAAYFAGHDVGAGEKENLLAIKEAKDIFQHPEFFTRPILDRLHRKICLLDFPRFRVTGYPGKDIPHIERIPIRVTTQLDEILLHSRGARVI